MSSREDLDQQIHQFQKKREGLPGAGAASAAAAAAGDKAKEGDRIKFGTAASGEFDSEIYGKSDKGVHYSSLPLNDDEEDDDDNVVVGARTFTAPKKLLDEAAHTHTGMEEDPMKGTSRRIADREGEYRARGRLARMISPDRVDPFQEGEGPDDGRSYAEIMQEQALKAEEQRILKKIAEKKEEEKQLKAQQQPAGAYSSSSSSSASSAGAGAGAAGATGKPKKRRWDDSGATSDSGISSVGSTKSGWGEHDAESRPPGTSKWDSEDDDSGNSSGSSSSSSSSSSNGHGKSNTAGADATPKWEGGETPSASGKARRSRWDLTPSGPQAGDATPMYQAGMATPVGLGAMGMATPSHINMGNMTPDQIRTVRSEQELYDRNRPLSDADLDAMFPSEGYKILEPPAGYNPIRTPSRRMMATPTPRMSTPFQIQEDSTDKTKYGISLGPAMTASGPTGEELPPMKPEDEQHFRKLLVEADETDVEAMRERAIMLFLLKIKNGTPPMRKAALRQITDRAREFGAGPLFNQILPLLMSPALEDQERHLLVKVIDRVLYKLDDLVRPYVHKILVVIEPMLIEEDYYARVEGREIISNLAKAAGLATMISTMRPDIDNADEYVRNTTARAFAVVASALGIPSLLPFLKAVCRSKKSWQARHTGIKIVQQIAILMGCAVLPHLKSLVDIIETGLMDDQQKVRTITALALAALAEAAAPYGIEAFDSILQPLWKGIREHRGKGLAAFLKAIGQIIPLMDAENASYYTKEVVVILVREFETPDEEMKKIVLKVVSQCCSTEGVQPNYIREEILPRFFKFFWVVRMALDRRNYRQLVDTTVELANKVGAPDIIGRIVDDLKEESEQYRKMVIEAIELIVNNLGATDIDTKLEERLIDGVLYAFQEQANDDTTVLSGFGAVVNALGTRVKPYLPQICGTILWRLNNKDARVRQQAADLISRVAGVMMKCQEEKYINHLGTVLYENLGEEYPEVLGSVLAAIKAIVNVIGMAKMQPPIKDLLPRLTPILRNRHEKVQENCIDLVGRVADRGAEFVSTREWMRICFELLDLLKAHKKAIRRAAVNTFGYIAKAVGPQDVLVTLLNNLKVQERQLRVCTTVAIAIVAETCAPFTVLPALMNEYRVPELNVQNGVLKSMSFLFEYIGEMGKDYIYAVTPLFEDALMDRDLVHRQTASTAIKHMALGVFGFGCEDALTHLLNYVWPNIFETSPHVINAVMDAIAGIRVSLGANRVLYYALQGLFHPARKVREVYWKIYNNLYIGAQDSLVAAYPPIPDDEKNNYRRVEMQYIL